MNHSLYTIGALKKLVTAGLGSFMIGAAFAAGGDFPLDSAPNRVNNNSSLQNGAKIFVNYCMGCHSAVN